MGSLDGTVSITGLPPHRGVIVHLCFYEVSGPDAPAPYGGNPPVEAATDCHKIIDYVHLDEETRQSTFEQPFTLEHRTGWYYVQVRAILFRERDGSIFAQAESWFYSRRPLPIAGESLGRVTLPVSWPATPLEELHHYGTISPRS
jgi:hypothetical protein